MPKWLLGYAGAVIAVGAAVVVQEVWRLTNSEWASWAQAIGTVFAVAAAGWIARYQARQDRQREDDRNVRETLASYGLLQAIVWRLCGATQVLAIRLKTGGDFGDYDRRYKLREEFERVYAAALELPVYRLPDFEAVSCLLDTRRFAKESLDQVNAYVEGVNVEGQPWETLHLNVQGIQDQLADAVKRIRLGLR